jgi:hypothetical protein
LLSLIKLTAVPKPTEITDIFYVVKGCGKKKNPAQPNLLIILGLYVLAEEVRFELTVGVNPRQFSRL